MKGHSLVWHHRPKPHVHRWQATCSCGSWSGIPTRRRREAEAQYHDHLRSEEKRRSDRRRRPDHPERQRTTPIDALPETLR